MSVNNIELRLNEMSLKDNKTGEKWGMELMDLYRLALCFYKEKSGKAIHLSYEDNLKLVAFTQQSKYGPLDSTRAPPLGLMDMIGKDRRVAWHQLGDLTKGQSMEGFIDLLDRLCPLFKACVEAIKKDNEEKLRLAKEQEKKQLEFLELEKAGMEKQKQIDDEKNREEMQRRNLQDALNSQTYNQFKAYGEKQFPGNPEQQAVLIRQLQNEHYHQYMQQLQSQTMTNESERNTTEGNEIVQHSAEDCTGGEKEIVQFEDKEQCESDNESGEFSIVNPANMWTRPDIKLFKQEVSAGKGDGVIRVSHGDVVTVRVPTHDGGACLFWEFATDGYDVGFGVYFEWGRSHTTEVSVHISESEDDEDCLDDDDAEITSTDDLESGSSNQKTTSLISSAQSHRPPLSIIVPVYRRECQNEVYAGSHNYPGEGVYLLKFDNSFSMWRSKTLYYRVFYTR